MNPSICVQAPSGQCNIVAFSVQENDVLRLIGQIEQLPGHRWRDEVIALSVVNQQWGIDILGRKVSVRCWCSDAL